MGLGKVSTSLLCQTKEKRGNSDFEVRVGVKFMVIASACLFVAVQIMFEYRYGISLFVTLDVTDDEGGD